MHIPHYGGPTGKAVTFYRTTFNVTDASNIIHMGNISGAGSPNYLDGTEAVYVSNNVAYVLARREDTFTTFNVTNASNIIHMGHISGGGSPNYLNSPQSISVSGNIAYIVSQNDDALTIFDVSNPSNIVLIDAITGEGSPNYLNYAQSVYVTNNIIYVTSLLDDALTTFEISEQLLTIFIRHNDEEIQIPYTFLERHENNNWVIDLPKNLFRRLVKLFTR